MNIVELIRPVLTAAALALLGTSGVAMAEEIKVMLSGDMEVPPVTTMASGSGSTLKLPGCAKIAATREGTVTIRSVRARIIGTTRKCGTRTAMRSLRFSSTKVCSITWWPVPT